MIKNFIFNKPNKEKINQKKLSLKEENEVINILNLFFHHFNNDEKNKIQKYIYNYENMRHHYDVSGGE